MNAILILSGGVGKRFGAPIPKQYLDLCGKPVIDYSVDYALKSKLADIIVVVIDKNYINCIKEKNNPKIHFVDNGTERVDSILNGLKYIKTTFGECSKIVITQAVSPFVTDKIIDDYFELLDNYDVVTTAEKCVGELFNIKKYEKLNRNNYYFCQSPEAFHFDDLINNIDSKSDYSEIIYHYSFEPKIFYYLDFTDNVKITNAFDLKFAEFLISQKAENG